ncbi:16S rRNA (uracil(1498)-N(3))-methyltransferase [soil metagenome]
MRAIRQFIDAPLQVGGSVALTEAAAQHLVRVLRLGPGAAVVLFNGDGHDYAARLLAAGKRGGEAEVLERIAARAESPLRITLAQALARGEKMDHVLQKAVELGVHAIVPVVTERTEVRLDAERADRRMQHWRGVLVGACEQCGRARPPHLSAPRALAEFASAQAAAAGPGGVANDSVAPMAAARCLYLDPGATDSVGTLALTAEASVVLVIGPEGGLSERDVAILRAARFDGLRLGPRILRTETAGLAAIAAINALYGDWR